jgi:hypothetical protein
MSWFSGCPLQVWNARRLPLGRWTCVSNLLRGKPQTFIGANGGLGLKIALVGGESPAAGLAGCMKRKARGGGSIAMLLETTDLAKIPLPPLLVMLLAARLWKHDQNEHLPKPFDMHSGCRTSGRLSYGGSGCVGRWFHRATTRLR